MQNFVRQNSAEETGSNGKKCVVKKSNLGLVGAGLVPALRAVTLSTRTGTRPAPTFFRYENVFVTR